MEWEDMKQTRTFIVVVNTAEINKKKGNVGYKHAKEQDLLWDGVLPLVMCHL